MEELEREIELEAGRFALRPETQARLKSLLLEAQTHIIAAEDVLRNSAKPRLAQAHTPEDLHGLRALLDEPANKSLLEGNASLAAELNGLLKEAEQRVETLRQFTAQFERDTNTAESVEQIRSLEQRLEVAKTAELAPCPNLQQQLATALGSARERVAFDVQFSGWVEKAQTRQQIVELERELGGEAERLHLRAEWIARIKARWQAAELRVTVAENELLGLVQSRAAEARKPEDLQALRSLLEEPAHHALAHGNPALAAELHRLIEEAEERGEAVRKFVATFEHAAETAETEMGGAELERLLADAHTDTLAGRAELQEQLAELLAKARIRIEFLKRITTLAQQAVNRHQVEEVGRQLTAEAAHLAVHAETCARWREWLHESLSRITAAEESMVNAARQRFAQAQNGGDISNARAWLTEPEHQALLDGNPKLVEELDVLAQAAARRVQSAEEQLRETERRNQAAAEFAVIFERDMAAAETLARTEELGRQFNQAKTGVLAGQADRLRVLSGALAVARLRAEFVEQFPQRAETVFTRREAEELRRDLDRDSAQLGLLPATRSRFLLLVKQAHQRAAEAHAADEQPRTRRVWAIAAAAVVLVAGALIFPLIKKKTDGLPPPPPDRGTLLLISDPLGAKVRQVRVPPGATTLVTERKTPATFTDLPPGLYTFEISAAGGFQTVTNEVSILAGKTLTTNFVLARQTGYVDLQAVPAEAEFIIARAGQSLTNGLTPVSVGLSVGAYQITLRRPGHPTFVTNTTVAHQQRVVVRAVFPESALAFTGQYLGARYEVTSINASLPPRAGTATNNLTGLPVGIYRVVVRNEGFEDIIHEKVSVSSNQLASLPSAVWKPRTIAATLPLVGGFSVTTAPGGAAVEVVIEDAIVKKISPATFGGLKPGKYDLTMLLPEYDRLSTNVTIKAGTTNVLMASLRLSPRPPGLIAITSKPESAEFRVVDAAGKEVDKGRTGGGPRPLPPGEYQVIFKHDWGTYLSASATKLVKIATGTTPLSVHHVFDEGTVRISSTPPGAQIKLGGTNLIGQTTAARPLELALPVGSHTFVASITNRPPKTKTLVVTSGAPQSLPIDFMGRAAISSSPPGADVWVDGQRQTGQPTEGLELLEGSHEIELRLADHESLKTNVLIVAGLVNRTLENRKLSRVIPLPPSFKAPAMNAQRWTNSLGMGFARVPVPKGNVLFCVHETRVQDFEIFAKEKGVVMATRVNSSRWPARAHTSRGQHQLAGSDGFLRLAHGARTRRGAAHRRSALSGSDRCRMERRSGTRSRGRCNAGEAHRKLTQGSGTLGVIQSEHVIPSTARRRQLRP